MSYDIEPISVSYAIPTASTAAAVLQRLHGVFNASTHWTIDDAQGTSGDAGFVVSPVIGGPQVNFRPSGASVAIVMDYDGTITNASTLAGAGDLSTERSISVGGQLYNKGSFHEWADAFTILSIDTGGTYNAQSLHAGRVVNPRFGSDPGNEFDGQGFLIGDPVIASGSSNWFGATTSNGSSEIHTGPSTWAGVAHDMTSVALGDLSIGGRTQPVSIDIKDANGARRYATARYLWGWTSQSVGQLYRDSTLGKDLAVIGAGGTSNLVHPVADGFDILA